MRDLGVHGLGQGSLRGHEEQQAESEHSRGDTAEQGRNPEHVTDHDGGDTHVEHPTDDTCRQQIAYGVDASHPVEQVADLASGEELVG